MILAEYMNNNSYIINVIYVGNFILPKGNASGMRVFANLLAMQEIGAKTYAFGFRREREGALKKESIDNIMSFTIPYSSGRQRLNNRKPFSFFKHIITENINVYNDTIVVLYGSLGTEVCNIKIIKWCRKKGIKVVLDQVDYYEKINKNNLIRFVAKKVDMLYWKRAKNSYDGYISISSYLDRMMPNNKPKIIVPPLSTVFSEIEEYSPDLNSIRIGYSTYMTDRNRPVSEWKDRIDVVIDVFYELKKMGYNFTLEFVGFTQDQLLDMFLSDLVSEYQMKIEYLSDRIHFHGLKRNDEVVKIIKKCDFTILLRDDKISTKAGFPTKVSESISLGVPVITNITSDIGCYVADDVNGKIVASPEEFEKLTEDIVKILTCDRESLIRIRKTTQDSNIFYYKNYTSALGSFIQEL